MLVGDFLASLMVKRNLADYTIKSYAYDLTHFREHCAAHGASSAEAVTT